MYLRTPRIAVFLLTSTLCGIEAGLAAWSVARAYELMHEASRTLPGASLNVKDALAVGGAVTAAAGCASILCLILLFFTLFRPQKAETLKSIRIKEGAFVFILVFFFGALVPASYYTATKSGVITAPGIPPAIIAGLVKASGKNLAYSKQVPIISYLVVGWLAFLSTLVSLILVSIAARKTLKYGTDGTLKHEGLNHRHAGTNEMAEGRPSMAMSMDKSERFHHEGGNTSAERVV